MRSSVSLSAFFLCSSLIFLSCFLSSAGSTFSARRLGEAAVGNADVLDDAGAAGGHAQRGVLHVGGLLTEDGAQQALFRGEFGLGSSE